MRKVSVEPGAADAVLTEKAVASQAMSQHHPSGRGGRVGPCPGLCTAAGGTTCFLCKEITIIWGKEIKVGR